MQHLAQTLFVKLSFKLTDIICVTQSETKSGSIKSFLCQNKVLMKSPGRGCELPRGGPGVAINPTIYISLNHSNCISFLILLEQYTISKY